MNATYTLNNETTLNEIYSKVLRLSTSASLGVLVTGMLLFLMCSLIAMDPPDLIEENIKIIDVVMSDERDIIEQIDPIVEKPVDPQPQPQIPEFTQSFDPGEGLKISIAPTLDPGVKEIGSGFSSGSAMAIFKVAPTYPRRQQTKGVEGFVDLMFDITPTGKTENIRVLYSEPEGAFDKSSVKALAKWKYKPAMEDGVAMAQKNQTTRITYELEK
ncbi:energy transducer TonB [Oceanicoccus sp. KOV_DT_Chl]|uniref:energy transducer TonB n=1 Tax=Oceanicoccus sp. KOV_DT_Chl TaxID=1904639 RepID=UPI000C7B7301|nr:energy transducer TonB [Oceanicoccus sp. KOV_DT_Chl]